MRDADVVTTDQSLRASRNSSPAPRYLLGWMATWLLGLAGLTLAGCGESGTSIAETNVRLADFPAHVQRIVTHGAAFVPQEQRFTTNHQRACRGTFCWPNDPMETELPATGDQPVSFFHARSGFSFRLHEMGTFGRANRAGNAITYDRPDGRAYWSATEDGVEEWLLIDGTRVAPDKSAAAWEIEGASLRQVGPSVEVLDSDGRARMRVTAPLAYDKKGRTVEVELVAHGAHLELFVHAQRETVFVDPRWTTISAPMNVPRRKHTMTVLPDGRVLIAGGDDGLGTVSDTAELFDPDARQFVPITAPMTAARADHSATLLANGKVLLAGGGNASAELFDPATETFVAVPPMATPRQGQSATLLQNGNVLIAGGATDQTELYDTSMGTWQPVSNALLTPRTWHTATRLEDGKVLVVGGSGVSGAAVASAEVYDPLANAWTAVAGLTTPKTLHSATQLPSGKVLVVGGLNHATLGENYKDFYSSSTEIFDPGTGQWSPASPSYDYIFAADSFVQPGGTVAHMYWAGSSVYDPTSDVWTDMRRSSLLHLFGPSVQLLNGDVLTTGGAPFILKPATAAAELYDLSEGVWQHGGLLTQYKAGFTTTVLPNETVLFTGASHVLFTAGGTSTAEVYDLALRRSNPVAPMDRPRNEHTATALDGGDVLVVGGHDMSNGAGPVFESALRYHWATSTWESVASMAVPRAGHTATNLSNGDVLVAGGSSDLLAGISAAEVFRVNTGQWTPALSMMQPRYRHTATALKNGTILVAGGLNENNEATALAEVFEPQTGQWRNVAPMHVSRFWHTATLVWPSGKVLVTGGTDENDNSRREAELYDPVDDSWLVLPDMQYARFGHTAMMLPNGIIVVAGDARAAEMFDPTTQTFARDENLLLLRFMGSALLPSGRMLVAGGQYWDQDLNVGAASNGIYLYDPASRWTHAFPMIRARSQAEAIVLANGDVLVTGGVGSGGYLGVAERYDTNWGRFEKTAGSMQIARAHHAVVALPNQDVLVVGGLGPAPLAEVERYQANTQTFVPVSPMGTARAHGVAAMLSNGHVLVAGGWGSTGALASAEHYDPNQDAWTSTLPMQTARWKHTATVLGDGSVLVVGGIGENQQVDNAELYVPTGATGTWISAGSAHGERIGHTATLLNNGKVLVVGGTDVPSAVLFDPATRTWTAAAAMSTARRNHKASLLPNGNVLIVGGLGANGPLNSAEVYDVQTNVWSDARALNLARQHSWAVTLSNGRVLLAGGTAAAGEPIAQAETFQLVKTGELCMHAADCESGFCVDGVCCNTACNGGACDGCSVLTGSSKSGLCTQFTGNQCDDDVKCTTNDMCEAGVCKGKPTECPALDDCHNNSTCDESTGQCNSGDPKNDGASCNAGDLCAESSQCKAGVCDIVPKDCATSDPCHLNGVCNPDTGQCNFPLVVDGTPCDDGEPCTDGDHCVAGTCASSPKICAAIDACHAPGTCENGECSTPVELVDGTPCSDDNPCTMADVCTSGSCTGVPSLCDCQGCGAYRCFGALGQCLDHCGSVLDCATGYVCDPQGACTAAPDTAILNTSGCAIPRSIPAANGWPWALVALLGLAWKRARR